MTNYFYFPERLRETMRLARELNATLYDAVSSEKERMRYDAVNVCEIAETMQPLLDASNSLSDIITSLAAYASNLTTYAMMNGQVKSNKEQTDATHL